MYRALRHFWLLGLIIWTIMSGKPLLIVCLFDAAACYSACGSTGLSVRPALPPVLVLSQPCPTGLPPFALVFLGLAFLVPLSRLSRPSLRLSAVWRVRAVGGLLWGATQVTRTDTARTKQGAEACPSGQPLGSRSEPSLKRPG